MTIDARLTILLASVLFAAAPPGVALAQVWQQELTWQMHDDHGCEVDFFFAVEEGQRDGQRVVRARVRCKDQRVFEAERIGRVGDFQVRSCPTKKDRSC